MQVLMEAEVTEGTEVFEAAERNLAPREAAPWTRLDQVPWMGSTVYPIYMNDHAAGDDVGALFSTWQKADAYCAHYPKLLVVGSRI